MNRINLEKQKADYLVANQLSQLVFLFFVTTLLMVPSDLFGQEKLPAEIAQAFGLTTGNLVQVEIGTLPGQPVVADIRLDGKEFELDLHPYSVRSPKYVLKVQSEDGSLYQEQPVPSRTVRGALRGDKGSRVVGSVLTTGLCAKIVKSDGTIYFIEPVADKIGDPKFASTHVVYQPHQTRPHHGVCVPLGGTKESFEEARFRRQTYERIRRKAASATTAGSSGGSEITYLAELGLDADVQFFNTYGSVAATVDRMELVINIMNDQYQNDVAILHLITGAIVRTMEPDPYSTTDASDLLSQFRSEWNNNQGQIDRDVAQLFTGKNLNGGTIGIAWVGVICNNFGYGLVESNFNGSLSCATDLSAHELGHNWNANHCNCPNRTMNPSITCANRFNNGSINSIVSHRNSRGCLDTQGAVNDDWINRVPISVPSTVTGTNVMATTESGEANLDETGSTVWWTVIAPQSGMMTVDLSGSAFDTQLQIYQGPGDSILTLQPIAGNDDDANQLTSKVSFPVISGTRYDIRVGGYSNGGNMAAEGDIALSVSVLPHGPVDFFWSTEPLTGNAVNTSNAVAEVVESGQGSLFLYYSPMASDIDTGAFLDVATSRSDVINFTRAETFEFDITVDNTPIGLRWGDAVGELGQVSSNFIDELQAFNVVGGSGMLLNNTGPIFFDEGYSFSAQAFLFAQVDFEVVGELGSSVDVISTRGSGLVVHDEMQLDPLFGNIRLMVSKGTVLLGDINCDDNVNLLDVGPFIDLLSSGGYSPKADFDGDSAVTLLDVQPFVDAISGS